MAVNKALTPGQRNAPALVEIKSAGELARRKIYDGIPDDDVALALAICQKYGLDPLLRHVVLIAKNVKNEASGQWTKRYDAYITRDGLLHIAHASGLLDGIEVALGKDELGEWAECTVYRKDMSRPFRYRVYLSEYAREPRGAWRTHPRAMLTKTAEVFALRRAFDVALTPVEEMGFEEIPAAVPVAELGPESITAQGPSGPAGGKPGEPARVGNVPAATGGERGTVTPDSQRRGTEKEPDDWPDDWPTEPPGVKSRPGRADTSAGNGSSGGRRRLF